MKKKSEYKGIEVHNPNVGEAERVYFKESLSPPVKPIQIKILDTSQCSQELEDSNSDLKEPTMISSTQEHRTIMKGLSPTLPQAMGKGGGTHSNDSRFKCVGFSENDKYASELLAKKWPAIKNWGDCTKINPNELPDFDMLCGGFPCQAFSIAGKRRGFEDTRGTLFFEITRIVKAKRPKIVFLENVKGLLNHDKGKTFRTIIQTLSELGYDVQWMVLNSKFFGVPQNRERVFIIGSLRGTSRPEILPFGNNFKESCKKSEKRLELEYDGDYQSKRIYSDKGIAPTIPVSKTGGNHIPFIKESDKEIN